MKSPFLSIVITLVSMIATGQTSSPRPSSTYEAANWSMWLLDNPQLVIIEAPPSAAKTKLEIQLVKDRMSKLDTKKMEQIRYWNSGAPTYRWNQIAPALIYQKPESMLRTPTAWMNIAIYDATILAWKEKVRYKRERPSIADPSIKPVVNVPATYSYPCEHSVTAAAAAYMLAYFFPEKADSILKLAKSASQSRIDAGVQLSSDVEAGWKLGEEVAIQIIEKAKDDGSTQVWNGVMNKDPKKWTGSYPMGITLASFKPIVLSSPDQFRPPAPPDFEADMKELKNFKQTSRTLYQAHYWANNGGFDFWSEVAALKMFEYNMMNDVPAVARIYTVLHTAYHEATIAIMDAKYAYWGIRPNQYDTTYKPQIQTPTFPGYPSGHAAGAATTSAVLEYFFPADARQFQQYAKNCAESRFYAGIHFRIDNETGLKMGKNLGKYVVETLMKK